MISKQELTKITIVSAAMILMLMNVVGAKYDGWEVTLVTDPCTHSVDFLKFPICGCRTTRCGADNR